MALTSGLIPPELEGGGRGGGLPDGSAEEVVTEVTTIEEPSDDIEEDKDDAFTAFILVPPFAIEEVVLVTLLIGWTAVDSPLDGEDIEEVVEDGEAFRPPLLPTEANSRSNLSSLGYGFSP